MEIETNRETTVRVEMVMTELEAHDLLYYLGKNITSATPEVALMLWRQVKEVVSQ